MSVRATGGVVLQIDAIGGFVGEQPLVAAAALLAVVLVAGMGVWGLSRFRRSAGERFQRLVGKHDAVTVLMHPNPDPDAMASAMAAAALAEDAGASATIKYPGQIRHQENRAFQTVLDQNFQAIETSGDIADETVVLVDHNEPRGFPGADGVDPIAVVDHHPGDGEGESFTDVRDDYGACATIFAKYFETLGWTPNNGEDGTALEPILATGMMHGIQSDTNNLTKGCSPAEFEAAAYLYRAVDSETLNRVANPPVDAEVLDVKARAITNRDVRNAFAVSDVGEVSNVDAIPQAATELLRLEGVTAVVVTGTCEGTLHLSGRSGDDRVHMGKALKAAVEDIPMAQAGGHARMGGGQLALRDGSLRTVAGESVDRDAFRDRLFASLSGDV